MEKRKGVSGEIMDGQQKKAPIATPMDGQQQQKKTITKTWMGNNKKTPIATPMDGRQTKKHP